MSRDATTRAIWLDRALDAYEDTRDARGVTLRRDGRGVWSDRFREEEIPAHALRETPLHGFRLLVWLRNRARDGAVLGGRAS